MDAIITSDRSNTLVAAITVQDQKISVLFDKLNELTEVFERDIDNANKEIVLAQVEFLVTRIRTIIITELTNISTLQSMEPPGTTMQTLLGKRKVRLIELNTRLTEYRQDYDVLNRLLYSSKFKTVNNLA
jgi:hypothetical protein